MKKILIAFLMLFSSLVFSQAGISIGILKFQSTSKVDNELKAIIEQLVYEVFVEERRFTIIERSNLEAVDAERFIQEYRNINYLTKINDLGANYIIHGEVNSIDISRRKSKNGVVSYEADIIFGLKIINVSSASVEYSSTFKPDNSAASLFKNFTFADTSTPLAAVSVSMKRFKKSLKKFVKQSFPIRAQIVSIEKTKKSKADLVLIAAGASQGIEKKMKLVAFQEIILVINGQKKIRQKEIAELRVERTEGDDFSLCKVKNGGAQLLKLTENSVKLFVKVKD